VDSAPRHSNQWQKAASDEDDESTISDSDSERRQVKRIRDDDEDVVATSSSVQSTLETLAAAVSTVNKESTGVTSDHQQQPTRVTRSTSKRRQKSTPFRIASAIRTTHGSPSASLAPQVEQYVQECNDAILKLVQFFRQDRLVEMEATLKTNATRWKKELEKFSDALDLLKSKSPVLTEVMNFIEQFGMQKE